MKNNYQRRDFLKAVLLGSAGFGTYSFLRRQGPAGVADFLHALGRRMPGVQPLHAAEILADALRFGPSLLTVSNALAQASSSAPAVFRVFYATSHDIRNDLCLVDHGGVYNPFNTLAYGGAAAGLQGKIQPAAAPHPIMNAWAYALLTTGKINGQTDFPNIAAKSPFTDDERNKISIITVVGQTGSEGIHRRGAIPRVGSLEYAALTSFKNYSPIGSVSLNTPIIDASGGVNNPGTSVAGFINAIDVPAVYMSREKEDNPVRALDDLTGNKQVKEVRDQMLDAHLLLTQQLANIKGYVGVAGTPFANYGNRAMEGLASMMMFADLFKNGLATVGSTGLTSFDFHATDALRAPTAQLGNMLTETAQAWAGAFHIGRACFDAKKDAIVHFTTCSNRNETWVNDDSHVSTITVIFKGSESSPFKDVPAQLSLLPDNIKQVYAEGPGNGQPTYSGEDAEKLKLKGGGVTVGRMEAGIIKAIGKALDQTPAMPVEEPAAEII